MPENQLFEELNIESINYIYQELLKNSENNEKSLIIMDDVQSSLKDDSIVKQFRHIIANQRHLKVVNLVLLQNYYAIDKKIREIVNNIVFFKMDKMQNEKIFREWAEMNQQQFYELNKFIFDQPHNWCFINNKRIYKMWDEVIINNDDDEISDGEIEINKSK